MNKPNIAGRGARFTITSALIFGFSLTLIGLTSFSWPPLIPWAGMAALARFFGFLVMATIVVSFLAKSFRGHISIAVVIAALLLAIVAAASWPLLVTIWFVAASSILGSWLLGKLGIETKSWINHFLVGAGVYGTVVGVIAHFPVNYPGLYGVALTLPPMFGWRVVMKKCKAGITSVCERNAASVGNKVLDVAIAVVSLVYFVVALMPEVGYDALATHLFVPAHMALRHQWGFDASTYVWAVVPMLGDWIFSIGYMLGGETAARLINVVFILVLGGLIRNIVIWAGGSAIGSRWAILIFLSTPLTFTEGSSLYIESVWAAFVVGGVLAVLFSCANYEQSKLKFPLAGIFLGFALATKVITIATLPVLLAIVVWRYRSWRGTVGLKALAFGVGLSILIGGIPYLTAWKLTGNPVFPLFNKLFKSPDYIITENFNNSLYNAGLTWDFIYRVTFESGKYLEAVAGAAGFQWLLLFMPAFLVLVVFKDVKGLVLLVVGIFTIVIVFQSQSYLRYVFPAWVILTAAIGVAVSIELSKEAWLKNLWCIAAIFSVALNLLFINAGNAFYRDFPISSVFGQDARDKYLLTRLPIRHAVELVNRLNVEKTPVAVFAGPLAAGLSADALYTNWYNVKFNGEISSAQSEQELADGFLKRGVRFIVLDSNWGESNCCGGGVKKQTLIENATFAVAEYGSLSVRKIKPEYLFKIELLKNAKFVSMEGWSLSPGAVYNSITGILLVSVATPAVQTVNVLAGRNYLNAVVARCAKEPALGRIQINWLSAKGEISKTNIKTFKCSAAWSEHTMELTAPPGAVNAVVFVTGHSETLLEFKSNSLRQ